MENQKIIGVEPLNQQTNLKKKRGRPPKKVFPSETLTNLEEFKFQNDGFIVEAEVSFDPYRREITFNGYNRQRIVDFCYPSKYFFDFNN